MTTRLAFQMLNRSKVLICTLAAVLILPLIAFASSDLNLSDGTYDVELTLEGGSGRATIEPESTMEVKDGKGFVTVTWSSPNYDYMIVDGQKLLPVNTEGNSVFEVPVLALNNGFSVIGDTVAMSKPHEIEYVLTVSVKDNGIKNKIAFGVAALLLIIIVALQYNRAKRNFNISKSEA